MILLCCAENYWDISFCLQEWVKLKYIVLYVDEMVYPLVWAILLPHPPQCLSAISSYYHICHKWQTVFSPFSDMSCVQTDNRVPTALPEPSSIPFPDLFIYFHVNSTLYDLQSFAVKLIVNWLYSMSVFKNDTWVKRHILTIIWNTL